MTNLEQFLNNSSPSIKSVHMEPASGSFACQNPECNEIIYEGFINEVNGRRKLNWVCSQGHESNVAI